jgi:hypothetical protein
MSSAKPGSATSTSKWLSMVSLDSALRMFNGGDGRSTGLHFPRPRRGGIKGQSEIFHLLPGQSEGLSRRLSRASRTTPS